MSDQEAEAVLEQAPAENGDAPPRKKAKGHPKKEDDDIDHEVEVKEDEAPKRRRGRPRKYPPSEKKVPSGRPRGRPKGSGKIQAPGDVPLASEKARNSRKPRGRPAKTAK